MNTQRDELAKTVREVTDLWEEPLDDVHDVPQIVNAILADGYSKPRTITTVKGLGTVYAGAILLDAEGRTWGIESSTERFFAVQDGPDETYQDDDVKLPATVIHEAAS